MSTCLNSRLHTNVFSGEERDRALVVRDRELGRPANWADCTFVGMCLDLRLVSSINDPSVGITGGVAVCAFRDRELGRAQDWVDDEYSRLLDELGLTGPDARAMSA